MGGLWDREVKYSRFPAKTGDLQVCSSIFSTTKEKKTRIQQTMTSLITHFHISLVINHLEK